MDAQRKKLDQVTPLASPPPISSFNGGLYEQPKRQSARSRQVDRLLEKLGIR
jgi:hypothetical protein